MSINTGRKIFANLQQIYADTGVPTGVSNKSNDPTDPDYIGPVVDLISCPPPVITTPLVNQLRITVINNSSQSLNFSTFLLRPEAIVDLTKAYYNQSFGIVPGGSSVLNTTNELDGQTRINALLSQASKNIRVSVVIKYKQSSSNSYTVVNTYDMNVGDSINATQATALVTNSQNINDLQLIITDNPVAIVTPPSPPIVSAGANAIIQLPINTANLTGTASSLSSTISAVAWTQVSGPSLATITNENTNTCTVANLIPGTYVFRFTATDANGASTSATMTLVVESAAPNPNGIILVQVDSTFNTSQINQIKLRSTSDHSVVTTIYSVPIDKTSGVVQLTPPKGTYNIEIDVTVGVGETPSLQMNVGGRTDWYALINSNTYVFENVVVSDGLNGTTIVLDNEAPNPATLTQVFTQIVVSSTTTKNIPLLPNGMTSIKRGNITLRFFSDAELTIPASFSGNVLLKRTVNDTTTSTDYYTIKNYPTPVESDVIDNVQEVTTWNYEDSLTVPVDHYTQTYSLIPGEGYLTNV